MSKRDAELQATINRLRLRIFLGIGIAILIIAPALTLFLEFRQRRYREILEQEAVAAENRGDTKEAVRLTTRQLEIRPGAFDPTARYARIMSKLADTSEERDKARSLLRSVLEVIPGRRVERRLAADLAMTQADYSEAVTNYLKLTEGSTDAETAEYEDLIAQCYEASQKPESAAEFYEKSITRAPSRVETYVRFANFLRSGVKDPQSADDLMDRMVQSANGSVRSLLERGRYRKANQLPGSMDDLVAARKLAPDDPEVLIASADLVTPDWDKAELTNLRNDVSTAFGKHPENARLAAILARFQLQDGQTEAAVTTLRGGLEKTKDSVILRWLLADLLLDLKRPKEAKPEIESLRLAKVRDVLTDFLLARVLMDEEKWGAAARAFEKIRSSLKDVEGLQLHRLRLDRYLAICYERLNDVEQKESSLRRVLDVAPNSVPDREELARIMASTGRVSEAIGIYRDLLATSPRYHEELARLLLFSNLGLPAERRKWGEAMKEIEEAAKASPGSVNVPLTAAGIQLAQGQLPAARAILDQALQTFGDRPEIWVALSQFSRGEGKNSDALALLDQAKAKLGDRLEFQVARIEYALSQNKTEGLKSLSQLEDAVETRPAGDQRIILSALSSAYLGLESEPDADRVLEKLRARFPDELGTQLALFERALRKATVDDLKRTLDVIRTIEGEGGPWGDLCEIRVLLFKARKGDLAAGEQARTMATSLAPNRPHWRPLTLVAAEIEDKSGSRTKALGNYLKAIALGESNPAVVRRTVELLFLSRRFDEARTLIEKIRDQFQSRGDLRRLNEDLLLKVKGPALALDSARRAIAAGSSDYKDHLWLAQLLWASGRKDEVEPALRQAIELSKENVEPWTYLVEYLMTSGRKAKAEATVVAAKAALGPEKHLVDQAYLEERVGHDKEADSLYQQALAASPDDAATLEKVADRELRAGRSKVAEPLLRTLTAIQSADSRQADSARLNLAIVLSEGGDNARCAEALSLVEEVQKSNVEPLPEDVREAQRAKGIILARQPGRPRGNEAVKLLEEAVRVPNPRPSDLLLLAKLHEENNNWDAAKERLKELMTSQGENLDFLAAYARGLLRRKDAESARPLFERMKTLDPGSLWTAEIEARVLKAEGNSEEAGRVLENYCKDKDTKTLRFAAALLEEIDVMKTSEALYAKLAAESATAEGRLNLAMFLSRRSRVDEALAVCHAERTKTDPDTLSRIYMYVLSTSDASDSQREGVANWCEGVLKQDPRAASVLLRLGTIRDIQGRYSEAEGFYKRAIAAGSTSAIPLNNLAWLLAFQPGRSSEALQLIDRAIAIAGPIPDLLDTRAIIYLSFGSINERQKGVYDMEKAVAESPTPARLFHLSQAYHALNDDRLAAATFEKAKAAGISTGMLHALERPVFQRLSIELTRK